MAVGRADLRLGPGLSGKPNAIKKMNRDVKVSCQVAMGDALVDES